MGRRNQKHDTQPVEVEHRLRSIMQTANDAIISIDSHGKIVSWNAAAERIFGYSEAEVVDQPLTHVIPERYRQAHEAGITRVSATGETRVIGQTVELNGLRRDGTEFPLELSLATWLADGQRFFSGIIRDITERKRAEETLHESETHLQNKAQELQAANEELNLKNEQLESLSAKLAKYLSHQVYDSIFSGQKDVRVESYRKKLTVFFSDIQGFTELTDRMESEDLTSLLNNYLNEMSDIALRHGGTIDKFIGDAVMIFFGDPETLGEQQDALACVSMALEMRERMRSLRREWRDQGVSKPLEIRMGINTGFCTVGNFGSENRLDYTIVGGQVNIASRLESAADPNEILISHETYALVKDTIACEPRGEIAVKGIAHPIQTYQVIDMHEKLPARADELREEVDGFSLTVDFEAIPEADRTRVATSLEKALRRLREKTQV